VPAPNLSGARELYAFERAGIRIWVVYTEEPGQLALPPAASGHVYGIDGRDLGPIRNKIPVPDGLAYVVAPSPP
jgi:hypothetical protein